MEKSKIRIDKEKLKIERDLNSYQKKLFQQLIHIIPDNREKEIIECLLIMHISGINQKIRVSRLMQRLGISEGGSCED